MGVAGHGGDEVTGLQQLLFAVDDVAGPAFYNDHAFHFMLVGVLADADPRGQRMAHIGAPLA